MVTHLPTSCIHIDLHVVLKFFLISFLLKLWDIINNVQLPGSFIEYCLNVLIMSLYASI